MPPRKTVAESRARLTKSFERILDRLLPPSDDEPLRLQRFVEFEDATGEEAAPILGMICEELAALSSSAEVADGGVCPRCGEKGARPTEAKQQEIRSRWGPVVYEVQMFRCRSCGRSFSPSAPRLAAVPRRAANTSRREALGT
jgi:hypothetical protein